MRTGMLVGYFAGRQEARDAFRKLRDRGYLRAAWVSRGTEGEVRAGDPFPWYRICGAAAAFIMLGGVAAAVWLGFQWPAPMCSRLPSALILQAPVEKLRIPASLLLESGGIPPAVFVLHPGRDSTAREQGDSTPGGTPLPRRRSRIMPGAWQRATDVTPNRCGMPGCSAGWNETGGWCSRFAWSCPKPPNCGKACRRPPSGSWTTSTFWKATRATCG